VQPSTGDIDGVCQRVKTYSRGRPMPCWSALRTGGGKEGKSCTGDRATRFPGTFPTSASGHPAIRDGQTRYNPPGGLPRLRHAIADDAGRRRGWRSHLASSGLVRELSRAVLPPWRLYRRATSDLPRSRLPHLPAMIEIAGGPPFRCPWWRRKALLRPCKPSTSASTTAPG